MPDPGLLDVQNERPYSGPVTATGTLTLTVKSMQSAIWEVTQVSIEMRTAPVGAQATLRKNGNFITDMVPSADVASEMPSVVLRQNDVMTVEWTGCTPGDIGEATVFYNQYRRGR